MQRLRQLALSWLDQAEEDRRDAARSSLPASVCQSLRDWASTRTNCAVELMRVLQEQEKENPLNGGSCSPHDADRESA